MADTQTALKEAGLQIKVIPEVRHMVEVLIEDFGYDELKKPVKKLLDGMKLAGYVGCQTNRPFGINGESFENLLYFDKLIETAYDGGAEMIVTPCPLCQANVEVYQGQINKR